ncbi:MAG TPA: DMT family transporter, partial [Acidimicrobiia bacterium]|nr:DMT family transporter [Acidimicrobiia bacterium]
VWGASFLFIAVGLEAFSPPVITFVRLALGALTLVWLPGARRPVDRDDWPALALLGLLWMTIPLLLFPVAQLWVDSSVAGMVNGSMPVFTAVVSTVLLRRLPGGLQAIGILVGFAGVVAITLPSSLGAQASPEGVLLLVLAVCLYAVAANMAVPLQQRYGALAVTLRAQAVALTLVSPFALVGALDSHWSWTSAAALVPLGVLGSGVAFVAMTTLVGRVGATRGALAIYFTPIVAIVLGVVVRNESVHPLALVGTALVIGGAWLTSRPERIRLPAAVPASGR